MFYKSNYLNQEEKRLIIENSLTFTILIKDRLIKSEKYNGKDFKFINASLKGNQYSTIEMEDKFFDLGMFSFIDKSRIDLVSEIKGDVSVDELVREKMEDLMGSGFFKVHPLKRIKASDGNTYYSEYISNFDTTIGDVLVCDIINIYDSKKNIVGYLKAKYTTDDILSGLSKRGIGSPYENLFLNKATIDYSNFKKTGDYSGIGLATYAYIEMAKNLNNRGISFRSSTMQSDLAANFWQRMKNNFPNFVRSISINGEKAFELSVPNDFNMRFNSGLKKNKISVL